MNEHASQLRPRRMTRRWPWVLVVAVVAVVIALDQNGLLLIRATDDLSRYEGASVLVLRAVSPHTLEVAMTDQTTGRAATHVRLWGVTAPLPAGPDRDAEPYADDAWQFTASLVENQHVILHLEPHRTRDTFNRLLAHIELPTGGTLNESLLEAGLAQTDERWPHSMLTRYAQAEHLARRRRDGLWADN